MLARVCCAVEYAGALGKAELGKPAWAPLLLSSSSLYYTHTHCATTLLNSNHLYVHTLIHQQHKYCNTRLQYCTGLQMHDKCSSINVQENHPLFPNISMHLYHHHQILLNAHVHQQLVERKMDLLAFINCLMFDMISRHWKFPKS